MSTGGRASFLVAGERRLRACTSLGWVEIPTRPYTELSEDERREIELEENVRRKDLTPYERSKFVDALAEQAAVVLSNLDKTPNPKGGRPTKQAVSETAVAERVGTPRSTINDAKQHVAAVQRYPELAAATIPQKDALTIAKNLDKLPEDERTEAPHTNSNGIEMFDIIVPPVVPFSWLWDGRENEN